MGRKAVSAEYYLQNQKSLQCLKRMLRVHYAIPLNLLCVDATSKNVRY